MFLPAAALASSATQARLSIVVHEICAARGQSKSRKSQANPSRPSARAAAGRTRFARQEGGRRPPLRDRRNDDQAAAARLPKRARFSRCFSLRGGSLNSRAAVPPRILCLAFSERKGRS